MIMKLRDLFGKGREKKKNKLCLYSEEELDEYEAYVSRSLGEYQNVFHEIVSTDIHLDVIMIEPDEDHPYWKLVTMGCGAYRMNVPRDLADYELEYAEYVIYLPKDWNLQSGDERDYWPIRALKSTGRLPLNSNSWLGYGHTIATSAKPEPYADNTGFCSLMLVRALDNDFNPMKAELSSGKKINFYQLLPLYPQELEYKFNNDADDLLDKLADQENFPVVDLNRKSVIE